jgi:hypothetical protein
MIDLKKFFTEGLKNTLLLKNNAGFSYSGPFVLCAADTVIDRWHIGDFSAAEYIISIDFDTVNREIVKCLVVAGIEQAQLKVYSRCSTANTLVNIDAFVNNSYVDIVVNPANNKFKTAKLIKTVKYFESQNSINTR